ncbi:thioesterase [Lentzea sp. NBRC 105346]|uniref:thioesterase II family protein n=1 Tax=Lentzea sp. NBRC 105346 TaxID=3032205 RepID=UPI0024A26445|nr:thioesterase domain-containing protein [Lentzea sp. NBRC 105346]GLZ35173.1 thioesterase [Lentzea sp. NBRC 105346]
MSHRTKWLLRNPAPDAEARLFCLPYSGVGASVFRRWPTHIGPLEVVPLQLPGRENRIGQPGYRDFPTFAKDAAEALEPYLDRPYAVFGHCMGAILAHALVTELPEPQRLYVSSSRVPHWAPDRRYRMPAPGSVGVYHPSMTEEQLAAEVSRVARTVGGADLHPDLVPLALRVLRGDLEMCFGYAPPLTPTGCPISTIGWTDDADVSPDEMGVWQEVAPTTHHVLPGDKLTFLEAPAELQELIEKDFRG